MNSTDFKALTMRAVETSYKDYDIRLRIHLLRELPADMLALYLAAALGDGFPTDWHAWMFEELEEEVYENAKR